MGRTEPSIGRPPAAVRKQQRAKKAKETLNKVIPAILASNTRAREGVLAAELFEGSQPLSVKGGTSGRGNINHGRKSSGRSKKANDIDMTITENLTERVSVVPGPVNARPPTVRVMCTDTLTAAASLSKHVRPHGNFKKGSKAANVAILNMASLLRPGGGFTSGATSQEEFLCMRTTLLPSLLEDFYRLPEIGGVFTPDVQVFRDSSPDANSLPQQERIFIDVVTAGMIRFPNVITRTTYKDSEGTVTDERKDEQVYASPADANMARNKMKAVLKILQSKRCSRVVLGAWGCGAYGNPVCEIARAWRETLIGTTESANTGSESGMPTPPEGWFGLKDVVFAISQAKMAAEFARAWGPDIQVEENASQDCDLHNDQDDDVEDTGYGDLEDLQEKIEQLQVQVDNARTPILRTALNGILQKLSGERDVKLSLVRGDSEDQ